MPERNKLKELCKECDNIKAIVDFTELVGRFHSEPRKPVSEKEENPIVDYMDVPSDISPESPEELLLARTLALCTNTEKKDFDIDKKAQWQRYWLRCCLSDKCNYYFSVFKECGINREKDVESLLNDTVLWKQINSDEGRNFYKRTITDWFLKRYNRAAAKQIFKTFDKSRINIFDKIKLLYPRLIGSVFIGFLPLITQKDLWEIPVEYGWFFVVLLSFISASLSYFYFGLEFYKATGSIFDIKPLRVFARGILYSLLMSLVFTILFSNHFIGKRFSTGYYYSPLFSEDFRLYPEAWLFFAFSSLLIGIFIQVLWEEKTVTEPL